MRKDLVFATNNRHKAEEIQQLLGEGYRVLTLKDIGCDVDIPETGATFAENASLKSSYVKEHYQLDCFADDSGLEVDALGLEPGVYSARYSGTRDDRQNLELVLQRMQGEETRSARFRTVISLRMGSESYFFEGTAEGHLTEAPLGTEGFGYDPIFRPEGHERTFAQMSMEEKNRISHRAKAMAKLIAFLKEGAGIS
ncbi:RdgB/HAM1 family non-canonical purine NTP pyrophosphatase [Pedobacter sp. JY14-1]|uniref:RdgB/HAM1 family non-canonical purine NTP pyrophosphatase n=1 Tax=Pedobacter sp. JY14-1 TaxID=3034151 RepID=UPI0023E2E2DB|nr:RdgB/HAM1 family non-canonical purine NTP pyrophosphatase [Pedobacter sp. JY14-1]